MSRYFWTENTVLVKISVYRIKHEVYVCVFVQMFNTSCDLQAEHEASVKKKKVSGLKGQEVEKLRGRGEGSLSVPPNSLLLN